MFKRMMILGAVASALALTGCQQRSQDTEAAGQQPATGGSGAAESYGGTGSTGSEVQGGAGGEVQGGAGSAGDLGGSGSTGGGLEGDTGGSGTIGGSADDMGGSTGTGTVDEDQRDTGGSGTVDGMDGKDDPALLREHGRRGNLSGNTAGDTTEGVDTEKR